MRTPAKTLTHSHFVYGIQLGYLFSVIKNYLFSGIRLLNVFKPLECLPVAGCSYVRSASIKKGIAARRQLSLLI